MELNQIRYMDAVSKYGSFTAAAEHLYITQPTLSQQIRRLEEELGFALFTRTTRAVTLTEAGRAFWLRAIPLLEAYEALLAESARLREQPARTIRLGVLSTFSDLHILDTVHRFQSGEPRLSVQMQIGVSHALLDMLSAGRLDVVIANVTPEQTESLGPEADWRVFARDVIHVLLHASHPLAGRERLTLDELAGQPLVMLGGDSSIRRLMERAFRQAGIAPSVAWECPEIHSLIGMLRSNAGISFLSSRVAAQYAQPPVVSVPLAPPVETQTAVVYLRGNSATPLLQSFSEHIVRCYQDAYASGSPVRGPETRSIE